MPSIRSQLLSRIAGQAMESMFGDFSLDRTREQLARIDGLNPAPAGVSIEPRELSHCAAEWIRTGRSTDRVVVYLPGGAWVLRTPCTHRRVSPPNWQRKPTPMYCWCSIAWHPSTRFPAGLQDCVEAYETLLNEGVEPATRIVMGGDSAGGNLTLGSLLALRDGEAPMPAGDIRAVAMLPT